MPYQIKVRYQTGDSFNKWDEETLISYSNQDTKWNKVDFTWDDAELAKENLARIKEYHQWFNSRPTSYWRKTEEELAWRKAKPKYVPHDEHFPNRFSIKRQDGQEEVIWPCWEGYFETLYGAEVVSRPEDGWSFSL